MVVVWLLALLMLVSVGAFCTLFGLYFAWKFFVLYLPN
jgi:hypothetical protein